MVYILVGHKPNLLQSHFVGLAGHPTLMRDLVHQEGPSVDPDGLLCTCKAVSGPAVWENSRKDSIDRSKLILPCGRTLLKITFVSS